MPFDPTLPVANSQVTSSELRGQFTSLKTLIDALPTTTAVNGLIAANSAANVDGMTTLSQTISNPPTQAQVLAIQTKLNDLIVAMQRA
jgi:hypothetical protein